MSMKDSPSSALGTSNASTLPDLLIARAAEMGDHTALRHHDMGIWVSLSWRDYATRAAPRRNGAGRVGCRAGSTDCDPQ